MPKRYPIRCTASVRFTDRATERTTHNYRTLPSAMTALPFWFRDLYTHYPDAERISITVRNTDGAVCAKLRYGIEAPLSESL